MDAYGFWGFVSFLLAAFVFVAYLFVLVAILGDLFTDHSLNGWWKAVWMVFLVFVPFLTGLVYVIVRGHGMAQRRMAARRATDPPVAEYSPHVAAPPSPSDEIAKAKSMLDAGTITPEEYEALKVRTLGEG
ncbi:SHOCT domain-containing protein [Agromyces sp. SYSU T00194]|uniref:SHOCT domain-containing protein n=1 Tax=Agromyces chitinivorans TaxID=3158560 RepID=UPI0033951C1B